MKAEQTYKLTFRPRKYAYDPEQIREWRRRGLSWEQIARKYQTAGDAKADHTTVMHAARRLGCLEPRALIAPAPEQSDLQGPRLVTPRP